MSKKVTHPYSCVIVFVDRAIKTCDKHGISKELRSGRNILQNPPYILYHRISCTCPIFTNHTSNCSASKILDDDVSQITIGREIQKLAKRQNCISVIGPLQGTIWGLQGPICGLVDDQYEACKPVTDKYSPAGTNQGPVDDQYGRIWRQKRPIQGLQEPIGGLQEPIWDLQGLKWAYR